MTRDEENETLVLEAVDFGLCGTFQVRSDGQRYVVCTLEAGHAGDHEAWGGDPRRPMLLARFTGNPEAA